MSNLRDMSSGTYEPKTRLRRAMIQSERNAC